MASKSKERLARALYLAIDQSGMSYTVTAKKLDVKTQNLNPAPDMSL
ncbi:hypothetical protein [Pseudescherichia sp.]|nr:hypothetical protein [Pseudescherichia sp.]